jgi:hypothetical protein
MFKNKYLSKFIYKFISEPLNRILNQITFKLSLRKYIEMKRLFNFLLAGTLMFSPYSFSGEDKQSNEPKILESKELLTQERPVEIVGEAIKTKEVKKRDLVNLIARIDDEEIRDRSEYAEGQFMEAYMKALEEDLNDDPLSMLGNNMKKMISSLKIK